MLPAAHRHNLSSVMVRPIPSYGPYYALGSMRQLRRVRGRRSYPSRPARLIVGFTTGQSPDVTACAIGTNRPAQDGCRIALGQKAEKALSLGLIGSRTWNCAPLLPSDDATS